MVGRPLLNEERLTMNKWQIAALVLLCFGTAGNLLRLRERGATLGFKTLIVVITLAGVVVWLKAGAFSTLLGN